MTKEKSQIKTNWKDLPGEFIKLRNKGYTIREIAQVEFLIDDNVRRFSIGTISKTIKKHEENPDVTRDASKHKDKDVVRVFKLLRKEPNLSKIVEKTNYHPDFVFKVAELYNKLENYETIPKSTKESLFSEASEFRPCKTYNDLFEALAEGNYARYILEKLVWMCPCCGKKYRVGSEEITFIQQCYKANYWTCNTCLKKSTKDTLAITS